MFLIAITQESGIYGILINISSALKYFIRTIYMFKLLKWNNGNAETSKENNCPSDAFTNHRKSYPEILGVLKS